MKQIAVLNGPNLDRLGKREPEIYGKQTLEDILTDLRLHADGRAEILDFQSNHEGELIEQIHQWSDQGITLGIINPAGFTHTSVALRDALSSGCIQFVEVHISHIHSREKLRRLENVEKPEQDKSRQHVRPDMAGLLHQRLKAKKAEGHGYDFIQNHFPGIELFQSSLAFVTNGKRQCNQDQRQKQL